LPRASRIFVDRGFAPVRSRVTVTGAGAFHVVGRALIARGHCPAAVQASGLHGSAWLAGEKNLFTNEWLSH
jgi:hypothetical protein